MSYKSDTKRFDEMANQKVKCECRHTIVMTIGTDRKICSWCKHWVYRTPEIKFRYKMKEEMRKNKCHTK